MMPFLQRTIIREFYDYMDIAALRIEIASRAVDQTVVVDIRIN